MRPRHTLAAFPLAFLACLAGSAAGAGAPASRACRPETPPPPERPRDVSGRDAGREVPESWGGIRAWFAEHGLTFADTAAPRWSSAWIGGASADEGAPAPVTLSFVPDTSAGRAVLAHPSDASCRGCLDKLSKNITLEDLDELTGGRLRSDGSGVFAVSLVLNFGSMDPGARRQTFGDHRLRRTDGLSPDPLGADAVADALGLGIDF